MKDRPSRRKAARRRPRLDKLGRWLCTRCRHHKPEAEFYAVKATGKPYSWCKTCAKISVSEYSSGEKGAATKKAFLARTRDRHNEHQRTPERREIRRIACMKYRRTARGKLIDARSDVRSRIAREADPARRSRLAARLADIEHELSRRARLARIDDEPEGLNPC